MSVPQDLLDFYFTLIAGSNQKRKDNSKCMRQVKSYCEDVVYGVHNRKVLLTYSGESSSPKGFRAVSDPPRRRAPKKNTHGETNIGIDFGSVSIHFPLRWALESINGKGKKIGKDLMKRNKRVQFRSGDKKIWKEIVPVVPKLEFKVARANNNMNGGNA
ncbi:hypothetical protein TNCV_2046011 [Trichonephila clavipes]|uniref:Uncharacterized protein n=1 Tax=Trichonephila clavipes TaxID=2585209 RepID=A0A8X6SVL2_TRICX|nr:hypothetical protein TNCV_2046011 [Trichonephila clavipes]